MRIYRARKDLFFREISATIMVGSMKRKKVRKPRDLEFYMEGYVRIGPCKDDVILIPNYTKAIHLERPSDCRRLARWLDRAADYLEHRSAKDGGGGV